MSYVTFHLSEVATIQKIHNQKLPRLVILVHEIPGVFFYIPSRDWSVIKYLASIQHFLIAFPSMAWASLEIAEQALKTTRRDINVRYIRWVKLGVLHESNVLVDATLALLSYTEAKYHYTWCNNSPMTKDMDNYKF